MFNILSLVNIVTSYHDKIPTTNKKDMLKKTSIGYIFSDLYLAEPNLDRQPSHPS